MLDVQDARGTAFADYYKYTDTGVVELGRKIRESMAQGRYAVVEGCTDAHFIELSRNSLQASLLVGASTPLEAHGNVKTSLVIFILIIFIDLLRRETNFENPHVPLDLGTFIDNVADPHIIQAILSCSAGAGRHPILVGCVSGSLPVCSNQTYILSGMLTRATPPLKR